MFVAFIPEVADCLSDLTGENKEIIKQDLDKQLAKNKEYIERTEALKTKHDESEEKIGLELGEAEEEEEEDAEE